MTRQGTTVKPDQHFGQFSLREYARREIIKEYEVGFATIPGVTEDEDPWPFKRGTSKGIRHDANRDDVLKAYGDPRGSKNTPTYTYDELILWFDVNDQVRRFVLWDGGKK